MWERSLGDVHYIFIIRSSSRSRGSSSLTGNSILEGSTQSFANAVTSFRLARLCWFSYIVGDLKGCATNCEPHSEEGKMGGRNDSIFCAEKGSR